jgi:4-amino-4-deoxy-L-arabinose transferase-like glycosyltransferase
VSSHTFQGQLLLIYVGLFLLVNVYYLWNIFRFLFGAGWKEWREANTGVQLFVLAYLVLNFGFSVAATVNILRYQYIPMLMLAASGLALHQSLEELGYIPAWKKQRKNREYVLSNSEIY